MASLRLLPSGMDALGTQTGTMGVMGRAPPQAAAPSQSVLDAWGVTDAESLTGGQGEAFRAGNLVLKPVHDATPASWLADVLDALPVGEQVRIARPAPTLRGRWLVDGWSAWHWLDGVHPEGAWDDVIDVSGRFHRAVVDVPWSSAMVAANRWAVADRVAWGEADGVLPRDSEAVARTTPARASRLHEPVSRHRA